MGTEAKVQHIFDLFDKFGHEMYIGESVTQLQVRSFFGTLFLSARLLQKHKKHIF